jgi:hypothetical protein
LRAMEVGAAHPFHGEAVKWMGHRATCGGEEFAWAPWKLGLPTHFTVRL